MHHPLATALDDRRSLTADTLDCIEEQAWNLVSSIRDLRIDLARLDSIQAKVEVS